MELELSDLMTLIHLLEEDTYKLEQDLKGPDIDLQTDAGELLIFRDRLSQKLKDMYEAQWVQNSNSPSYNDLIKQIKTVPPFTVDTK